MCASVLLVAECLPKLGERPLAFVNFVYNVYCYYLHRFSLSNAEIVLVRQWV